MKIPREVSHHIKAEGRMASPRIFCVPDTDPQRVSRWGWRVFVYFKSGWGW